MAFLAGDLFLFFAAGCLATFGFDAFDAFGFEDEVSATPATSSIFRLFVMSEAMATPCGDRLRPGELPSKLKLCSNPSAKVFVSPSPGPWTVSFGGVQSVRLAIAWRYGTAGSSIVYAGSTNFEVGPLAVACWRGSICISSGLSLVNLAVVLPSSLLNMNRGRGLTASGSDFLNFTLSGDLKGTFSAPFFGPSRVRALLNLGENPSRGFVAV